MPPNLADLVAVVTQSSALNTILSAAQSIGLTTTAWQPLGMARTILATMAQVNANYSNVVNFVAQGGWVSLAARMVDLNGNPVTSWMDLCSTNFFNVTRIPAAVAAGNVNVTNVSGTPYTFAAGQLHFANPSTGATYTSSAAVTIAGSGSTDIPVVSDKAGAAQTSGSGVVLTMVTPLAGVSVNALAASLVGTDAESNQALLVRCTDKLGSLSPNGAKGAYAYVAKTTTTPSGAPITRVAVLVNMATGAVQVILANAAGAPAGGDVSAINTAIQAVADPNAVTVTVTAATAHGQNVTYTVAIPAAAGVDSTILESAIAKRLAIYFSQIPIGGVTDTDGTPNVLPVDALIAEIFLATVTLAPGYEDQIEVTMTVPASRVSVGVTEVMVLATVTGTVVQT
jgi:hypothetical protein